jgi:BCD family chlorophyll transporter-like MFS transporter
MAVLAWAACWRRGHGLDGHGPRRAGMALAVLAFAADRPGRQRRGTSLLVLLAKRVAPERRAGAATAGVADDDRGLCGHRRAAPGRCSTRTRRRGWCGDGGGVVRWRWSGAAGAVWGLERPTARPRRAHAEAAPQPEFRAALRAGVGRPDARRFTVFVFVSMLAYSAQDLILEPFAGMRARLHAGRIDQLSGVQHGGVLAGMLLAALAGRRWRGIGIGSAARLDGRRLPGLGAGHGRPGGRRGWWGRPGRCAPTVFVLGVANGAFSIAAIASMMALATEGRAAREGVRMGLWGAAQAIAFGVGGVHRHGGQRPGALAVRHARRPTPACSRSRRCCSWWAALAWRIAVPPAPTTARRRPAAGVAPGPTEAT